VTNGTSDGQGNLIAEALEEVAGHWVRFLAVPFLTAVGAVAASFLVHPRFEAVAIFAPAEDASTTVPTSLQSIAGQFGIAIPSAGFSVYYFAQVLQSRAVLERVANDTLEEGSQRIAVTDLLEVGDETADRRLEKAVKALQKTLDVRSDDQAELVTVRTVGPSPALARSLAQSVLKALDSVSTMTQRTGGSYQRRFAQAQADTARQALVDAEDRLRAFYQSNRSIASSPTLQVEEGRLRRQIQIFQDVYLALVNQAEAAKLQEARNTPTISIIQPPLASARKVFPRRGVWALFALITAFMVVAGWTYIVAPALRTAPPGSALHHWQKRLQV
jgi:uncharacterized protein involved in exopolysaccharide biosynthesis